MTYPISVADVDKSLLRILNDELVFYPKPNKYIKKQRTPTPLKAYNRTRTQYFLPLRWSLDNLADVVFPPRPYRNFYPTAFPLNDRQQVESNKILATVHKNRTALLASRTGGGKTFLFLNAACNLSKRTIILVWIQDHIDQIVNSIKEFTTAVPGVVTSKGLDNPDADIVVCLYTRWNKLSAAERTSFALLVVDELHLFYNASGLSAIQAFTPEEAIGCTATFENDNSGLHVVMYPIFGDTIVSSAFDVAFDVDVIQTGFKGERCANEHLDFGIDFSKLAKSLMYNPERNELIVKLACHYISEGEKVLIITEEIEHTLQLYEALGKALPDPHTVDYLAGKKKTYKDSSILVGISKRCAVGFDEKMKCPDWGGVRINRVMIVCSVASSHKLVQMCGRSFRSTNPKISHFVDDDSTIERQFSKMLKDVYEPLGGNITYVTVEDSK